MTEEEQGWIDDLVEVESGLFEREIDFVEDMASQKDDAPDRPLTQKQHDWLERIWERLCR